MVHNGFPNLLNAIENQRFYSWRFVGNLDGREQQLAAFFSKARRGKQRGNRLADLHLIAKPHKHLEAGRQIELITQLFAAAAA